MFDKKIFFLLLVSLVSCTALNVDVSTSQKVQIRQWLRQNPNLNNAPNDQLSLDVDQENIVDYDVKLVNNVVYFTYITDRAVMTIPNPIDAALPTALQGIGVTNYQEVVEGHQRTIRYWTSTSPDVGDIHTIIPEFHDGVWVRIYKGTIIGRGSSSRIAWESIFSMREAMKISDVTILPLKGQETTVAAVSNNTKIIVFNDSDLNGNINFLSSNLLHERSFSKIDQLNTWQQGNDTYLAAIGDDNVIVTGRFRNFVWSTTGYIGLNTPVSSFQVKGGKDFPFATWVNKTSQKVSVAMLQSDNTGWREIDSLASVKHPKLNISLFVDDNSIIQEHIYLGTVNEQRNFFQLFQIRNLQTYLLGDILNSWNERYAFAGNEYRQVLYTRANFDQQLIFAGLDSSGKWDVLQRNNPPPFTMHSDSTLDAFFVNSSYKLIVYRRTSGSIFFLAGID